jgi:hypothetical protein
VSDGKQNGLSDPIVREVLESHERETKAVEFRKNVFLSLAGHLEMLAIDGYLNGNAKLIEAYKHWKETGEAPPPLIDFGSIQMREDGKEWESLD